MTINLIEWWDWLAILVVPYIYGVWRTLTTKYGIGWKTLLVALFFGWFLSYMYIFAQSMFYGTGIIREVDEQFQDFGHTTSPGRGLLGFFMVIFNPVMWLMVISGGILGMMWATFTLKPAQVTGLQSRFKGERTWIDEFFEKQQQYNDSRKQP